jgi:hypothetical protein
MQREQPDPFAQHPLQARQRSYGSVRPRTLHRYSVPCFSSLGRLPWHQGPSSRSSTEAPESSSRPLYAGHHPPSTQAPDGLVPEIIVASGFDVCCSVSTPQRGFVVTRLLDSYLTHHMDTPSPPNAHDHGLQPRPLGGGLEPAPAGRLRRVGSAIASAASHAARSAPCRPKPHCCGTLNYLDTEAGLAAPSVVRWSLVGVGQRQLASGV